MKSQKVFIGGRVDVGLKRLFLQELRKINRRQSKRVTQAVFLELLLLESVKVRKKGGNANAPKAPAKS